MRYAYFGILLFLLLLPLGCGDGKSPAPENPSRAAVDAGEGSTDGASEKDLATTHGDRVPVPGGAEFAPRAPVVDSVASAPAAITGSASSDISGGGNGAAISDNLLTAGSFNDALNLDIFSDYWKESSLSEGQIAGLEQPNWKELIPAKSTATYQKLDLSFVIDATGSMGDELAYLQAEIGSIAQRVATLYPNIKQRYGLVMYRDHGDEYVVRKYDFTEDLVEFQKNLSLQESLNGGDYPEAMDEALSESLTLQWSNEDSNAKLMFLVADAPPHDDKINQTFKSIFALRDKNIRMYPVAASGVHDLAESVMRTAALLTGGQYIFLTDDSGIGNAHAEPKFPCYFVEKLNDVLVRVISDALTGSNSEPPANQIIRTVGRPVNGVCAVQ